MGFFDFGGPDGGPDGGLTRRADGWLVASSVVQMEAYLVVPDGGPVGGPVGGLLGGPDGGLVGGLLGGPVGGLVGGLLGGLVGVGGDWLKVELPGDEVGGSYSVAYLPDEIFDHMVWLSREAMVAGLRL